MMTFIIKPRALLKSLLLAFLVFTCLGFSLPPQVAERLARLPWVGRFIPQEAPPEDLRQEAQKALEEARLAGAARYAPQALKQARAALERAERLFREGRFVYARKLYQESLEAARKAQEEAVKRKEEQRAACRKRLEELRERLDQTDLETRIRLRYLESLIEQEMFDEFEAQWREMLARKRKRGPKPPSSSPKGKPRPRSP